MGTDGSHVACGCTSQWIPDWSHTAYRCALLQNHQYAGKKTSFFLVHKQEPDRKQHFIYCRRLPASLVIAPSHLLPKCCWRSSKLTLVLLHFLLNVFLTIFFSERDMMGTPFCKPTVHRKDLADCFIWIIEAIDQCNHS